MNPLRLTYGTLPTLSYYRIRYAVTFKTDHPGTSDRDALAMKYSITHGTPDYSGARPEAGDYSADELWRELNRLCQIGSGEKPGFTEAQRENAYSWAADILGTLGIEWI